MPQKNFNPFESQPIAESNRRYFCSHRTHVQEVLVRDMSYDEFMADLKTQDAVIRNIEIIGEAAKKLPNNFKIAHSSIPWKAISGTSDRLIHDYSGVNYDIVWVIIVSNLPSIQPKLNEILQSEEKSKE